MNYPGAQTDMRLHEGEDWKVVVDPRNLDPFDVWESQRQEAEPELRPSSAKDEKLMERAWDAAPHHFATLRRIGWIDQKGRVWTKIPPISDFDGGSLTPLLIDTREH